ncbi:hypothetical protein [Nocardiopsis ganjiahuensis]|uniref:hypothetical protein n=1 Tax=Nocardiopsis ganjiahuensis TaxID=239984 RepID=UPI001268284E|nr:hypothetical protein [Nocardiopsis ganjiahuensis]
MAAPHPGPYGPPPPHVDPGELRPSRAWLWVGGALIPLSLIAGAVLFVVMLVQAVALPEFAARTQGSQSATFTVDDQEHTEQGWLLYGSPAGVDHTACALTGPGGERPAFNYPTFNHEVEGSDGSWAMIGMTRLSDPGEYTLTCRAPENVRFGLAYGGDTTGTLMTGLLGALGSLLLLPFLGVVGGVLLIIVTVVRRGRHRQQLINERTPHGPRQGPYPGPPQDPRRPQGFQGPAGPQGFGGHQGPPGPQGAPPPHQGGARGPQDHPHGPDPSGPQQH